MADRTADARAAHHAYLETRRRIHDGEAGWVALADHFTDDAWYVDPAWGRVDGIDAIRAFLVESMAGLDDWTFPEQWTVVADDLVVSAWMNRLPGRRADGTYYETLGISELRYADDGKFSSERDLLNLHEVTELIVESGWMPGPDFNVPPKHPRRR